MLFQILSGIEETAKEIFFISGMMLLFSDIKSMHFSPHSPSMRKMKVPNSHLNEWESKALSP